jgi:hypothetical protein
MSETKPAPRPTGAELARYFEADQLRLQLNRQAKDLADEMEDIEEKAAAYVRENGGKARCLVVCDYRLALETKPGRVDWKANFVQLAGAEAAEELRKAAPTSEALKIDRPPN